MTTLQTLLRQVTVICDKRHQPWALVGGLAVSVRTEPRFTRDLDLALAVDDDREAEQTVLDLQASGFRALAVVEQEATGRLATARLAPAGVSSRGLMLDLLFASSGIEREICEAAERLEIMPGCRAPVARLHHLMALKVLARDDRTRPQDVVDLRALSTAAQPSDFEGARDAVQLIEARGFNRSRNLVDALTSAWQEFRV